MIKLIWMPLSTFMQWVIICQKKLYHFFAQEWCLVLWHSDVWGADYWREPLHSSQDKQQTLQGKDESRIRVSDWKSEYQKIQLICRTYSDTLSKPWEADILRCGDPDNIPDFRVNRDNFGAVIKVCGSVNFLGLFRTNSPKLQTDTRPPQGFQTPSIFVDKYIAQNYPKCNINI